MTQEKMKQPQETPKALTMLQKIALQGELGACYEKAVHKDDMLYYSFILLATTQAEYRPYYMEEMLEHITEEELAIVNRYAVNEMFPTSLYVNKFISDIRSYLGVSSCNLKDRYINLPKSVIKSKFTTYVRMLGNILPSIVKEVINAILTNETGDLGFLQDIAFSYYLEIQDKEDATKDFLAQLKYLQTSLADIPMMSFMRETNSIELTKDMKDETLAKIIDEVVNEVKKNETTKSYIVYKKDKVTNNVTALGEFPSQAKALEYMKTISKDYPDLLKRYELTIVTVTQNGDEWGEK